MTQNIYDTTEFFEGYSQLPRSLAGFEGAPEWPAMQAILPPLTNTRVADLGCGFGWFCRWAGEQRASEILGLDVSENMLARAKEMTSQSNIEYLRADLEELSLQPDSYDIVYSSLTFHYLANLDSLLANVYQALKPGGWLVFSAEHPIFTAPSNPGWISSSQKRTVWPVDQYLVEGQRKTDWFATGVIKQHRTLSTYLNMLITHGFNLKHLNEWKPDSEQIRLQPELAQELERPMFFIAAAQRL
ncbi:class I SAM-dependent methyltransferase [Hahella ganghwensis]|uniref:class I SAM-dependent methyltransferase n=1 Tax=Hahella ganghwensis TaxID=286420 RepID=UPI0003602357|nr:class I SAM-dependent methyltransferase [Hahella ganghwensis]